ncbi:ATPase [Ectopseudomonas mendocina]|uniref:ATPase n=1 Tax=Ectopseudomonas mendocina TaxID=300 RepID=A0ABZ2RD43_ECTME
MRNDQRDEFDNVPSLRADVRDRDFVEQPYETTPHAPSYAAAATDVRSASTGPLWALIGALLIGLGGLGWWSFQQIRLMEQQLVATQESFARISEEAAGRIQDISGKVVATETSVNTGSEALKLQVRQLESKAAELSRLLQGTATAQRDAATRVEQLTADLKARQTENEKLAAQLSKFETEQAQLKTEQANLKSAVAGQAKADEKIAALRSDVDALKKQGNPNQAVARLEQDLLVLRSELDNRATSPAGNTASTAEFDAFRAQMTRNINALQAQVQNLQKQIDER